MYQKTTKKHSAPIRVVAISGPLGKIGVGGGCAAPDPSPMPLSLGVCGGAYNFEIVVEQLFSGLNGKKIVTDPDTRQAFNTEPVDANGRLGQQNTFTLGPELMMMMMMMMVLRSRKFLDSLTLTLRVSLAAMVVVNLRPSKPNTPPGRLGSFSCLRHAASLSANVFPHHLRRRGHGWPAVWFPTLCALRITVCSSGGWDKGYSTIIIELPSRFDLQMRQPQIGHLPFPQKALVVRSNWRR